MALVRQAAGSTSSNSIAKAYRASIFEYQSKTYAVVTKNQTDQASGGFVVVDISNPSSPTKIVEKTDLETGDNDNPSSNWELLNGSFDVATAVVDSIPYAVISQNLGTVNSKGGITIVRLTNNDGNITATSPSVVRQIQDGDDSFHGSNKTQFKNARGLALQQLGEKTYLFTTGNRNTDDKGFLQVYDFDNLIDGNNGNDTSALVSEIVDSTTNRLSDAWDIKTFSEGGKAYALISSQKAESACSGTSTFHQPFEFNPSENSLQKVQNPKCWPGRVTSGVAVGILGAKRYVAVVSKDDDPGHTQSQPVIAIYDYTDPSNPSQYLDALLPDDSNSFLEGVSQIALTEVDGKYYVILPNSKSGSNRVEFIEFKPTELNPGTGRLGKFYYDSNIVDGSQDLEGATFSRLATAVDAIPFTVDSKSYALIASNGDQAIQIIQLSQPVPTPAPSPTPTPSGDDDADSTPPELRSAVVSSDGLSLSLKFNEPLASTTRHVSPAFVVDVDGQSIPVIDATTRGGELTLSLARSISNDQTVALAYTDRSSNNDRDELSIGDASGNDLASFARFPVQNRSTLPGTPPSINAAVTSADGRVVSLSYDHTLSPLAPHASFFSLAVDGVRSAFSSLSLAGSTARLGLSAPLFHGQALLLNYRDPTVADDRFAIQDIHGNDAIAIQGLIVENNSTVIDPATLLPAPLPTPTPTTTTTSIPAPLSPGAVAALSQPTKESPRPTPKPTTPTPLPAPAARPGSACDPEAGNAISESQRDRFTLLLGSSCSDQIIGSPADDILKGVDGDDTLRGLAGDDRLRGGSGADRLKGGLDHDSLSGGSGDDRLKGRSGNDQLLGGPQRDSLDGGKGDDSLSGGSGADLFRLSSGNDQILDFNLLDADRITLPPTSSAKRTIKLSISQPQPDQLLLLDPSNGINTTLLNTDITPEQLLDAFPKLGSE